VLCEPQGGRCAPPGPVETLQHGLGLLLEGEWVRTSSAVSAHEESRSQLVCVSGYPPIDKSVETNDPPASLVTKDEPLLLEALPQIGSGRLADTSRLRQGPDRCGDELRASEKGEENLVAPGTQTSTLTGGLLPPSALDVGKVIST
jgi:hypothetical protein